MFWSVLLASGAAYSGETCQYLNDYQSDDAQTMDYIRFYAKMGLGKPVVISVPECVAVKSRFNKDEKAKSGEDFAPANFVRGDGESGTHVEKMMTRESTDKKIYEVSKPSGKIVEKEIKYPKGTAKFCKGYTVCEDNYNYQTYVNVAFCRANQDGSCPSAEDCRKDQDVVLDRFTINGAGRLSDDRSPDLGGEQTPKTSLGR
jgi:hypothetical protein